MTDNDFNATEKHQPQIPALRMLVALGFKPLSQAQTLDLRDDWLRNLLADRRVREALSLAIPCVNVPDRLYHGQARAADQFAAPVAKHWLPGLPPLLHDRARARALLVEAQAMTTMDPERRAILAQQAAQALLEDKGLPTIIILRNIRAAKHDTLTDAPGR